MKVSKKFFAWLCACIMALQFCTLAMAEDFEQETEPETEPIPTMTAVETTTPKGTLTPETSAATTRETTAREIDPPFVQITRESFSRDPKAGEAFVLTIVLHNYSNQVSLIDGSVSFEPSEGLVLEEKSSSKVVSVLGMGSVRSVPVHFRVAKNTAAGTQSVAVTYSYNYRTPEGLKSAQATEKLIVPVQASAAASSASKNATPNIIVSKYSYGGTIAAGDAFTLDLQFRNTSQKTAVENIVMSVETGDGLSITSASNTYYFQNLAAGKTQSQRIPMRVSANAGPEGTRIDIAFRYEYVDNGERGEASASEKLSVPIYVPDRFTVTAPEMDSIGVQNQEMTISLPYINKSKSTVSNVQAQLIYDETLLYCEQPRALLGNIEPGKNGTIDFFFVPMESGSASVKVQVTYENELVEEKTVEIDVPYSVDPAMEEPMEMEEPFAEEPQESGRSGAVWIIAAVGAIVLIAVVIVAVKKKRKKAAQELPQFDWSVPESDPQVKSDENR
ncbi:MAG: COG1361 S-layer family protein [Acutalibacteraceae bacterium]